MMCFVAALAMSLFAQDPASKDAAPPDDTSKKIEELAKRVEALELERTKLLEQIRNLERFGQEAAETISRLKKTIATGGRAAAPVEPAPADSAPRTGGDTGPLTPVYGKIMSIAPEHGFMIVSIGESDGVKEGWMFEVIRARRETDGNVTNDLLGKAVFEKYVSTSRHQSKLKIVEGDAEKMKYGDSVVANRRMEPLPPREGGELESQKLEPRTFKIVGVSGDTYFVNAGSRDKLKQSDRVFVYRDKRAIAQLRLDRVEADYSAGKIIDNTKTAEPAQEDEIHLKDLKTSIVGKVKRIEISGSATGAWIEVGQHQGVRMGMQFEVRRQSKAIGRIVVKSLSTWHSVCDPVAPLTLEDLRTEDFIESVE